MGATTGAQSRGVTATRGRPRQAAARRAGLEVEEKVLTAIIAAAMSLRTPVEPAHHRRRKSGSERPSRRSSSWTVAAGWT
jgi:hypothetical protein